MKLTQPLTLSQIAGIIQAEYEGPEDFPVNGLNEIHRVQPGDIVFVDHPKYYDKALNSAATIILINKKVTCPPGKALLFSDDPFRDFNVLINHFRPFEKANELVSSSARIGQGTVIQPGAFIGNHVRIGKNCLIHPQVTIYDHCQIGDNVIIHAGAVIGGDGFYYKKRQPNNEYDKLLSCGVVIIEDDVEIGAGCSIDKGVTAATIIGKGSKLDNHVHIGHDTVIGKNCLFAAQVGIAGVVNIEDNVTLWGQVGVISDITIGKGAVVLAQAGVGKSLKGNTTYFGSPASEARKMMRELAAIRQIPELVKRLDQGGR